LPIFDFQLIFAADKRLQLAIGIGNWKLSGSFLTCFARAGLQRAALALAELATSSAALQRTLIRTQTGVAVDWQHAFNFGMRAGYHMDANQLANASGGRRTCIGGSFHCSDVAADKYRHVACADVFLTEELYVRRFHHRVSCFHRANEPFGFNHAECF
jgi:hypothetical protein